MLKNIFKTLMIGIALCATCSIVAVNAGEPVKWKNGKKYIVHSVKAKETLFGVCKTYHLTQAELVAANPQAKGGLQKGMNLLIPAKGSKDETAQSTAAKPAAKTTVAKQATPAAKPKVTVISYKTKAGETMYSIAKKNNTTVADLKKRNAAQLKGGLKTGMTLKIAKNSAGDESQPAAAAPKTAAKATTTKTTAANQSGLTVHEVKKGETMFSISKQYGVDPADVARLNPDAKKHGVKAGKMLIMPSTSRYIAKKKSEPNYRVHKVQNKETVFSISKKYHATPSTIIAQNGLKNGVKSGQFIALPPAAAAKKKTGVASAYKAKAAAAKGKNSKVAHTVKKGETMFSICKTYKVTESELKMANPEIKKGLKQGCIVFIPRADEQRRAWGSSNFVATQGNNKVKVAVMLPFEESGGKIDRNTDKFLEFEQGMLLAINNLKKAGVSVDLYTYNSGKSAEEITKLLGKPEMKTMDLIIGPAYKAQFKPLSDFVIKHDIKMVVPFSSRTEEMKHNHNIILINAPHAQMAKAVAHKFANQFGGKNVIIVKFGVDKYNDEEELGDSIVSELRSDGKPVKVITYSSTDELKNEMSDDNMNVVVPVSTNQVALSQILPSINAANVKKDVVIFGFEDWTKYQSISKDLFVTNTYYASAYDIDFDKPAAKEFIADFRRYYGQEPNNTQPMYGALGYDIMLYFGKAVAEYGKNFEGRINEVKANTIQSDFYFTRLSAESGLYNHDVTLIENNSVSGHKAIGK
jgi:LysM repeat protein